MFSCIGNCGGDAVLLDHNKRAISNDSDDCQNISITEVSILDIVLYYEISSFIMQYKCHSIFFTRHLVCWKFFEFNLKEISIIHVNIESKKHRSFLHCEIVTNKYML